MKQRLHFLAWAFVLCFSGALFSGCASPQASLSRAGSGAKPGRESEAETERRIKAYAHYATGLQYDLDGNAAKALDEFEKALEADSSYEPLLSDVARRLLRDRETDRAVRILKKAAAQPGATGPVYAWLGLAYSQGGHSDLAIEANRAAIRKMPRSLPAYQNLAQIYLQNNRTNEALQALNLAAKQSGADAAFLVDLADLYFRFHRAQPGSPGSLTNRAAEMLGRAAALKPEAAPLRQRLGDSYHQLGDFRKSAEIYSGLLKEFPASNEIRAKLIDAYLRQGEKEKAAEQLGEIAKQDPTNPRTYLVMAAIAMEAQAYEEASAHFEKVLILNPNLEEVYYELAGIKLALERPQEALTLLQSAQARFKSNFTMEFYLGVVQAAMKNYREAIRHYTSAEVMAGASEPARLTHQFYYQVAGAYERSGNVEEAEKHLRKSLELSPDFADALNFLGYMWTENGKNYDEARVMIEKAVKAEPKNAAFLDSMAWVLFKQGKVKDALGWMLKAVEHSEKPDPTLYDHLGDIYAAQQQYEKAHEAWRKSLGVEDNEQVRKKLDASLSARSPRK